MPLSNNLTKSLGFNAYQLFYTESDHARLDCIRQLNHHYDADFLTELLESAAGLIQAKVLNISTELYKPHGTSVTMLVAEQRNTILGHLDKSHLTVHTYADPHLTDDICSFRLDFDLASCGPVSPLTTLELLFDQVDCHLVTIDYRIRGYSRDRQDRLVFNDHSIDSIAQFIPEVHLSQYNCLNANMPEHNLYHSKLVLKELPAAGEMNERGLARLQQQMNLLFELGGQVLC